MRKTILGSLTSLLIPFAAYGANISYGAYQRRQSTYIGTHQPLPLANGQRHSFVERTYDPSAAELDLSVGTAATELVIIDAAVPDKHILYRAIKPGVDIVEIASTEPGLAQLTGVLSRYRNLSALHIVSHAANGELLLGNSRITAENIKQEIETFAALNGALRDGGDLLFYGCDLAADEAGAELLEVIRGNTHLDLAASSDKTGAGDLQGDWELEIRRGDIETGLPFSDKALKDFSAVLAASNGTYGFQTGWSDAGNTLTHTHFVVGGRDANTTALLNVSIYNLSPFPAYIQTGHTSAYNYFYVLPDGVNTGSFELTGLTAGEYATGQFTNVRIVGVLRDDTQITSSTINGTGASEENFTFGAGQLANFAGVQLKAFKLYFDTTSDVGSTVPFFEFRTFTVANAQNPADNDGNLTAAGGVTEPVGLATTIDTVGEAVDVFDFTIADGGAADIYNLTVSELFINVSGTSTDAERGQITWRLNGPDASNVTGTYSAASDRITFSGLGIDIANGGNETYTVNAYFNNNTNVVEDHTIILSIDGDTNLTVGALGTQMGSTTPVNNGAGTTIDVTATQLAFTTQPAGSVSGTALTTQPVVTARDAFGNTDVDFTETITLTEASAGSLSGDFDVAAVNGVATFTDVVYTATADQESFTLTANDQDGVGSNLSTVNANAVTSDVVATKLLFTTHPSPTNVPNAVPTNFTTVPVVSAVDANDTVDTGYSTGITLAEVNGAGSAAMSVTSGDTDGNADTVTITPASGVATFTGMQITYTASGASNETFNLRASSGGLTTADSNQLTAITNNAPTDIALSANNINQSSTGAAVAVGTLSTTDADGGDSHTYSLVNDGASGNGSCGAAGDDDNASFQIDNVNDELETAGSLSPGNYNVCIQTSDGAASYQKSFTITVDDDVAPTVSSVSVPANATYITGQNLNFTVNTNENVTVNTAGGTPQISLTVGSTTRQAAYLSGSGTSALVFRYTVQSGDLDTDGITVGTLSANGGTLQDGGNNNLNTTLNSVGSTASVLVDGIAPTISSVSVPANGTYVAGQNLDFTVNTDENVTVNTGGGTPQIALTVGATTRQAMYLSGSGTSALVFRYTVQAGDLDTDGIAVAASIDSNGGTLRDNAGNDLDATLNSVGSTASVLVDAVAPTVSSVSVPSNGTYTAGQNLDFTVNTNENVTVNTAGGTPQISLTIGATARQAVYLSGSGTSALVFRYTVQAGDSDTDGIAVGTLSANGGTLQDGAGNDLNTTLNSVGSTASVLVDAVVPTVSSVSVPANGSYGAGQNLDFTVNTNENVTVDTGGGTPQIALTIGATTRQAVYLSGSGTSALVFRHTVQAGDLDIDGIAVAASIDANSGTLQDAAGNDMTLTLNSVGDTSAVLVDASAPVNNLPAAQITDAITQLVFSSGNGNAISIADDGSLTVVISIGSGTLTASTGGSAGISNNGTGTVTITGTAAEVNVALEGLTYTPNGSGVQTLNMLSTDGAGNTDDDDLEITVNAATLVVTSNLDTGDDETAAGSFAADQADGSGLSIREALNWARPGDTITFDLDSGTPGNQGGTIILNGNQLTIAYNNIRIDGDLNDDGSADVTISGNNASRVMSVNASLSGVELTGLTLTQGTGVGGAGLSLGINVSLTLRDSTVTNNTESGLGGGGIYGSSVTLTIINSTISNNSSDSFGGGIRAVGTSTMNLINSTVNGNTTTGASQHGGGIQYAGSTLTIINSTISGNAVTGANADGGGLRISTGTSFIYNTTIVGNAAANNGGGVSANGTSDTFINTVVAGNTAGAGATAAVGGSPLATGGAANDVSGTIETATNSYFGTTATITTDNSSLNNQGTGNLLLDNLGNYDGNPVQTHFPQTGSALLEAGSNVALPPDTFDLDGDSNTAEALPIDANGNPRVSNIVDIGAVEGDVPPAVTSVGVPANGTYIAGQNLDFTVNTDENITVDTAGGTPSIALTIGATTRQAVYLSGSGTSALVFRYTVQAGDNDVDGIAVAGDIDTNGGTLRNGADEDLATALNSVGSTASVLVDTVAPTVGSVSVPANGTYTTGQNLDFTVNYNENVTVNTGGGTPRLALTIGATSRFADYVSGSGSTALVFRYTVQPGDNDSDGIALSNTLQPNGGTLRDAVSNNADTNLGVIGSLAAVLVDARAPSVNSVTLPANSIYTAGQNLDFTVNYDEAVTVNTAGGTPRLALSIGATARFANYVSGSGGNALVFRYTVQAGDTDSDGIALSNTLQPNGGTLRDANGNDASTNLGAIGSLGAVLVDAQAPSVNSVTLPADGSYREGQNLNFTVNYDEVVTVNTAGGTPRLVLTIGVTTRYADYVSGSGGTTLLFRYTVQAGDNDSDGIALNTTLDVNGGTLRDTASNNAGTNLGAIGDLAAVLVDTQSPSITSVTLPANATYLLGQNIDFTVNYDENVTVTGTPRLALTIGATTRYATYNSGSGTNALLFRYTAQNGDSDGDGIELDTTLDVNGGTLRDAAGNDADTNLGVNDLSGVLVDALDTDGDGVSDVQEGIDGTDPNDPDDYLDNTAPVITSPADLVIDATGLYTPVTLRQLLGLAPAATDEEVQQAQAALATDNIDGADCCNTQAQGLENDRILLQPGQAQIVWQGSDRKGNNGQAVQNVNVRPLVSVGKDQTGVEGSPVIFRVILNGLSPVYPLDVPYTIDTAESSADNADHDLVDGVATFNAGETEVSITVNLLDDGVPEGDEVLVVRLDDPDINAGANIIHRITITEGNVAPNVALNMQQNAVNVALVANNGGDVTVTANVTDPNAGDTHGYDWLGSDSQLTDTDGDVTDATFVFDPTLLTAGVHTMQVSVTDSGGATVTRLLHFSVVAEAPVLDLLDDTDGDGIDDVTEGIADSDGDGIPDYLDNIAAGNVLPESVDVTDAYLIECEPGVRCRLGSNALPGGGVRISADDLPEDTLYTNVGGLFDFEIHDLPVAGQSTRVVIPQIAAIPADAAYRKFANDQWFTFVEDANNALHSTQGEAGFCPPPGDASWEPGLVEGYLCVQVTLEDGGANDADGLANGSIADPGGVGQPVAVNPPGSSWTISGSTKGGGGALGLPAGLALLLLVLLRNGRRAAKVCGLLAALLASAAQAQESEAPIADEAATESMEDTGDTSSRWQRLRESFGEKGYLTLGLYQAEGDQSSGDFVSGMANDGVTVAVQGYDVSRTAYQLSLGYRYHPGMAVEFGYLDLGDVDFSFTANAANAAALSNALSQNLPVSSDGWLLSHRFDFMFGDWRTSADVGLYFWDGKASINDPSINANLKDGVDPLIGLQVAYPLPGQLELALQYRRILFDDQNVELWGGALSWSF